ncbi:hypothetical protein CXB51_019593 [Gossypium anomalum]|uniref:Reverse transcriptase n=1 Tax=Gossypium anomalum TaxID=47600 RepID=A0A8J5YPA0_9ROSI|nr:hypothetical protein CXB51_019593 [Gossypium anomalum]
MAIKIDLENAYDRVSWVFIDASLQVANIPDFLRKSLESGFVFGVPLFHDGVTISSLKFVVDKVKLRLQSWDVRQLSLAGRVTLAQVVLLTIPTYFMQSLKILQGICDEIESILGFNILTKLEVLYVGVLRAKYGVNEGLPLSILHSNCFFLWRALSKIWPLLRENIFWSVGDAHANFVVDYRLKDGVTKEVGSNRTVWKGTLSGCFSIKSTYCKVKEHSWNPLEEAWKLPWKKLLTQAKRLRRCVSNDAMCTICGHGVEDVLYAIRDCDTVKKSIEEIIKGAYSWARHYGSIRKRERIGRHTSREDFVGTGKWICIRFDGAVKVNTGFASTGGVLRDQNGDWILGFNRRVGICSVYEVKLWGIIDSVNWHKEAFITDYRLKPIIWKSLGTLRKLF